MIDTISDGEKTYQTFLTALKTFLHIEPELLGIIHYDSIVKKSVQAQTPLLSFDENSISHNSSFVKELINSSDNNFSISIFVLLFFS
jgi:wobble nucleotide-excising tRNase